MAKQNEEVFIARYARCFMKNNMINFVLRKFIQAQHLMFLNIIIYKKSMIMIRKLRSGEYRLYSKKTDPKTKEAAKKHEQEIQYFKRQ